MYFLYLYENKVYKVARQETWDYNRIVSRLARAIGFHYARSHLQTINLNNPTLKR